MKATILDLNQPFCLVTKLFWRMSNYNWYMRQSIHLYSSHELDWSESYADQIGEDLPKMNYRILDFVYLNLKKILIKLPSRIDVNTSTIFSPSCDIGLWRKTLSLLLEYRQHILLHRYQEAFLLNNRRKKKWINLFYTDSVGWVTIIQILNLKYNFCTYVIDLTIILCILSVYIRCRRQQKRTKILALPWVLPMFSLSGLVSVSFWSNWIKMLI